LKNTGGDSGAIVWREVRSFTAEGGENRRMERKKEGKGGGGYKVWGRPFWFILDIVSYIGRGTRSTGLFGGVGISWSERGGGGG